MYVCIFLPKLETLTGAPRHLRVAHYHSASRPAATNARYSTVYCRITKRRGRSGRSVRIRRPHLVRTLLLIYAYLSLHPPWPLAQSGGRSPREPWPLVPSLARMVLTWCSLSRTTRPLPVPRLCALWALRALTFRSHSLEEEASRQRLRRPRLLVRLTSPPARTTSP